MSDLAVNIGLGFFLGFLGATIALAYRANGRCARLDTNYDWLTDALRELIIRAENFLARLFDDSPAALTREGRETLEQSGLKSYIDSRRLELVDKLQRGAPPDVQGVQNAAFRLLDSIPFDDGFAQRLSCFALQRNCSADLLRRVGAIYLRDIALKRD